MIVTSSNRFPLIFAGHYFPRTSGVRFPSHSFTFMLSLIHKRAPKQSHDSIRQKCNSKYKPAPLTSIVKLVILPTKAFFSPLPLATTLLASPKKRCLTLAPGFFSTVSITRFEVSRTEEVLPVPLIEWYVYILFAAYVIMLYFSCHISPMYFRVLTI